MLDICIMYELAHPIKLHGVNIRNNPLNGLQNEVLPSGHNVLSERQMNVVFKSVRRKLTKNPIWT